jgi:hypothetical protein
MKTEAKKNLTGKLIEKKDLGRYSKSLGKMPLYYKGTEEQYARLYE